MVKKPLALDLCAGLGGWTKGLLAAGWDILGIDTEPQPEYPGEAYFLQMDIRDIHPAGPLTARPADKKHKPYLVTPSLIVASPPCQEFSYRHLPFGRVKNLPPPDKSIWNACERIAREYDAPLVLENVIGAQKFMGKAKAHYGSYYLWGDVPPLLPIGRPTKGFGHNFQGQTQSERGPRAFSSKSPQRKAWSANAAVVPFELAYHIGWCFKNQEVEP